MAVVVHRDVLREVAFETHGVVTLGDAEAAGVPDVEVRKLASRGALTRIGQGVYMMNEAPTDGLTEFAVAVSLVGGDAVLIDDSVLAAHDLAQVNVRRVRVATIRRVRKCLPGTIEMVRERIPVTDRDDIDGVPAMRLGVALLRSRGRVMASRLIDATWLASARGLLDREEAEQIVKELSVDERRTPTAGH